MASEISEITFGPPIFSSVEAIPPDDRPVALAIILDVSSKSVCGDKQVLSLFQQSLVNCLSGMESDHLFYFQDWHEDPGSAVAAVKTCHTEVRDLSLTLVETVNALAAVERHYRRKLLLVTDQFMHRDFLTLKKACNQSAMRYLDIAFLARAFGPLYSRSIDQSGWDYKHLDDPTDISEILAEVWK